MAQNGLIMLKSKRNPKKELIFRNNYTEIDER